MICLLNHIQVENWISNKTFSQIWPHMYVCCYPLFTPHIGGAISIALDEDGLAQYADLRGTGQITRYMLVETVTANILKVNGSMKLLEKCKMESYVASTGKNLCCGFYLLYF